MKNKNRLVSGLAALFSMLLISGCATVDRELSEVPVPVNFQGESMMKLKSVSHWNNVAIDMANGVAKKYGSGNGCIPGFGCKNALYVKEPVNETKFSKAFHTQLISALVNQGLPVVTQVKPNVTVVEIDIQVVQAIDGKTVVEYDSKPTELTDGVWVIRDLVDTSVQKFKTLNVNKWTDGESNKSAWFRSAAMIPSAEMMVTVSFVNDGQFIARTSNIYYLSSSDGYVSAVVTPKISVNTETSNSWSIPVYGDCTQSRCYAK